MPRVCFQCSCTRVIVFLVFFLITSAFIPAALDWALARGRTPLQAILTRMNPYFVHVEVNAPTEGYYRLWRYHDFGADFYREPRSSEISDIPVVYVHGNAGSFQDMRSIGRFVGEANVNERRRRILAFEERVKMKLFNLYKSEGMKMPIEGEEIPHNLQRKAEDMVIVDSPILGVELFGVDFLEESTTQSSVLLLKEARFLNHSMHRLMQGFLDHYETVPKQPKGSIRREADKNEPTLNVVVEAEKNYIASLCTDASNIPKGMSTCVEAKKQIRVFSSVERLRREVERVRRDGLWVWTESLGGLVALFATLFAPHLYAGLVMAGSPTRYPPLLFDSSCVQFQRVVHEVALPSPVLSFSSNSSHSISNSDARWPEIHPTAAPHALLAEMAAVSPVAVAARVARVALVNVNGGALEDVVPPRSSTLGRRRPRGEVPPAHRPHRRDISTEELRGCGMPLTHRGLVYARQLLDVAANSLVRAALAANSGELLGSEASLPLARERLFPTVEETLPKAQDTYRKEEFYFSKTLRKVNETGVYRKENNSYAQSMLKTICVDGSTLVNVQDIPENEDPDTESWQALHLFIGATTYKPEDVLLPELYLMHIGEEKESVPYTNIHSRAATKLHLAKRRKDSEPIEGSVLNTAVSFQVLRKGTVNSPIWVRPRFCFLVERTKFSNHQFSYIQHDMIDPSNEMSSPDVHKAAMTLQQSEKISLENHGRFTLIRNVDSMMMETNMVVRVNNRVVFPHVICGSFRSFRVAFRGTEELAIDEPESQLQYFFGPYETQCHVFHYSWRPFQEASYNSSNVYLVYVLTTDEKPNIRLWDFERYENPKWDEIDYVVWRIGQWSMRWMAVLATYSLTGRYAGCYVLVFLTLYTVFYVSHFLGGVASSMGFSQRMRTASPVALVLVTGILLECFGNYLAKNTLSICLNDELPIVSDENLTSMMSLTEKLTLIFLYALPPKYEACKYSWIRMQTIAPDNVHFEHIMHMICAFCFAAILILAEFGIHCLLWPFSAITHSMFKCCSLEVREKIGYCIMIMLWFIPVFLLFLIPWLHISIIITLACLFAYSVIWFIPSELQIIHGPRYRWICFMLTMILHLTSHFQGLILVVRNYFIVPSIVLHDSERFEPSTDNLFTFAVVQCGLLVVYGTVYLTRRHCAGVENYNNVKKKEQKEMTKHNIEKLIGGVKTKESEMEREKRMDIRHSSDGDHSNEASYYYVLGDINRQYPRFKQITKALRFLLCLASLWVCMISIRRPLEGSIATVGLCLTGTYIALTVLQLW
ncbi:GPI inositol-deacylase PGAP1-like [Trypanosoma melophagium]|uniref:GPI inositol-deacylase PGAP1-like n=1 Tax=Trypanosoma melophagium TaxID=715481 RepID=UPI00351A3004|nr:GPI inositol-deacylase PGAP1-like [Trypanosoma melophagium]